MYQETKKTICIADDSESFLFYLRILLERLGFRIIPLKSGSLESTVAVEYGKHGFCGVHPKSITLTALPERLAYFLWRKPVDRVARRCRLLHTRMPISVLK